MTPSSGMTFEGSQGAPSWRLSKRQLESSELDYRVIGSPLESRAQRALRCTA